MTECRCPPRSRLAALRPQGLKRCERGAVAPIIAILGSTLIGSAALALDVGLYYNGNRALQSVTQAAALSAAIDPANALTRARAYLVANGYPASAVQSAHVGRYCADMTLTSTARFVPAGTTGSPCSGNGQSTAVRLTTSLPNQQYVMAMLGTASPTANLTATATAARIDEAGMEMTSGALTLDVGIVNALLTALTGSNIALNASQIQTLLGSEIDAGIFFDKLAARVGQTGTYASLVSQTVTMTQLLGAAADASRASNATATATVLDSLAGQIGGSIPVPLAGLFDLGVWEKMPVGHADAQTGLRAGLNAYQLIAYALQTNNRNARTNGLNVTVPAQSGVRIASVELAGTASGLVERARFGFGPQGETRVSTAVTRIKLNVHIANLNAISLIQTLGLVNVNATIPILIEIGAGTADLSSISCGQEAATDSVVRVSGSAGLLRAFIGTAPADAMTQPFRALNPSDFSPVTLVEVPLLLRLTLGAYAGPIIGDATPLTREFRRTSGGNGIIGLPPYGGSPAPIGNNAQLAPLLTDLGNGLHIDADLPLLGVLIHSGPLTGSVTSLVGGLVRGLGVDPLVDTLLGGLGVRAGFASIWVTGVRCGVPVLV
jgi:uncharacterized membrane protein